MASKLAIKHKDSLALKESKLLHKDKCETHRQPKMKRFAHFLSLPWLLLSVFLVYWLVLCPLTWAVCYASTPSHWSSYWPSFFWIIAFLIWIAITCGLLISKPCYKLIYSRVKQNHEINATAGYGSGNTAERSIGMTYRTIVSRNEDAKSDDAKRTLTNDPESRNDRGKFQREDLPPLVIHKRMSGEQIEDAGVVHVEKDEKAELNTASEYVEKSPLQDYLKLVTVSPSEDETKSPNTPMSPRELFFIDLIREADKAESAPKTKRRFFPSEAMDDDARAKDQIAIKDQKNGTNTQDSGDVKDEKDGGASEEESKRESYYFIADVDNSLVEKTQVFLQIGASTSEQVELIVEKPVSRSNEANSHQVSTLRADPTIPNE